MAGTAPISKPPRDRQVRILRIICTSLLGCGPAGWLEHYSFHSRQYFRLEELGSLQSTSYKSRSSPMWRTNSAERGQIFLSGCHSFTSPHLRPPPRYLMPEGIFARWDAYEFQF